jgi:hypothetical protein
MGRRFSPPPLLENTMSNDPHNISGGNFGRASEEFKVATPVQNVCFDFEDVAPPPPRYLTLDDRLLISTICASGPVTVQVTLRILRPDGKIIQVPYEVPMAALFVLTELTFPLVEGFLLSATAMVDEVFGTGAATWVQLDVVRTNDIALTSSWTILAGYVDSQLPISYPQHKQRRPQDGAGMVFTNIAGPVVAGGETGFTIFASARAEIISVNAEFDCSIAVANRFPDLVISDAAANPLAIIPFTTALVATNTAKITWGQGLPYANSALEFSVPLPNHLTLKYGYAVSTSTRGLTATDVWKQFNVLMKIWFDLL